MICVLSHWSHCPPDSDLPISIFVFHDVSYNGSVIVPISWFYNKGPHTAITKAVIAL